MRSCIPSVFYSSSDVSLNLVSITEYDYVPREGTIANVDLSPSQGWLCCLYSSFQSSVMYVSFLAYFDKVILCSTKEACIQPSRTTGIRRCYTKNNYSGSLVVLSFILFLAISCLTSPSNDALCSLRFRFTGLILFILKHVSLYLRCSQLLGSGVFLYCRTLQNFLSHPRVLSLPIVLV